MIVCCKTNNWLLLPDGQPIYAKANPGKVNFSSQGIGSIGHLTGEMFKLQTGVDIVHVSYAGTAPSLTDLMAGQVQMTFDAPASVRPLEHARKLRVLATTGADRDPQAPELPTLIESGLHDVVAMAFFGVLAPAGTPACIVGKLNAAINQTLNSTDMQAAFAKLALRPKSARHGTFPHSLPLNCKDGLPLRVQQVLNSTDPGL